MKTAVYIAAILMITGCSPEKDRRAEKFMELQIRDRIRTLDELKIPGIEAGSYHKKVDDLVLLSKDIENLQAAVNMSNEFFTAVARQYAIPDSDFVMLATNMHVDQISFILRQNELNLLNRIIFKMDSSATHLYTAQ